MEELRENLHTIIEGLDLTDPKIVEASQKLDVEVVRYMKEQMNISA